MFHPADLSSSIVVGHLIHLTSQQLQLINFHSIPQRFVDLLGLAKHQNALQTRKAQGTQFISVFLYVLFVVALFVHNVVAGECYHACVGAQGVVADMAGGLANVGFVLF